MHLHSYTALIANASSHIMPHITHARAFTQSHRHAQMTYITQSYHKHQIKISISLLVSVLPVFCKFDDYKIHLIGNVHSFCSFSFEQHCYMCHGVT